MGADDRSDYPQRLFISAYRRGCFSNGSQTVFYANLNNINTFTPLNRVIPGFFNSTLLFLCLAK